MATKIATDSEILTQVSHKCTIVPFSLYRTVSHRFLVIRDFRYNEISYRGPPKLGVLPLKSPNMVKYQQDPQTALPCMGTHALEH